MSEPIMLKPIGIVESPVKDPVDENWGAVISRVILRAEYASGLLGLSDFSHVIVVTYLHKASFDPARHLQRAARARKHAQGRHLLPVKKIVYANSFFSILSNRRGYMGFLKPCF